MLTSPLKDFYVKVVEHAIKYKFKNLNELEAELMVLENSFLSLKEKNMPPSALNTLQSQIHDLKRIIKHKKNVLSLV